MSQVLSQGEVDALLKGIAGGDDEEDFDMPDMDDNAVIPYDLTSQDRIIRGRMPTLEIIHDRFVRRTDAHTSMISLRRKRHDIPRGFSVK